MPNMSLKKNPMPTLNPIERGRVFDKKRVIGSLSVTDYKDPPKVIKRWTRK